MHNEVLFWMFLDGGGEWAMRGCSCIRSPDVVGGLSNYCYLLQTAQLRIVQLVLYLVVNNSSLNTLVAFFFVLHCIKVAINFSALVASLQLIDYDLESFSLINLLRLNLSFFSFIILYYIAKINSSPLKFSLDSTSIL